MNSPFRTRWPLLLTGVFAVISFGSWWFFAPRPTQAVAASLAPQRTNSDDAAASQAPKHTTVYDSDPQHLWNRLHDTFRARIWDQETDPWELDPFLWRNEDYLAGEKGQKAALEVLDEFIAKKGHTLIKDPLKRALLQRDLWTLFDSLRVPRWGAARKNPQMELATRLARIIPRLSLTAEEIKKLPNNYAEAVAAKEAWFLPADLWEPKGPWVLLGDKNMMPLALTHVDFFGGRSTFFVFLRLPDGREQTEKYLAALRKLAPGAAPDAFPPGGADAILVRQMQLIDDQGKPVTTNVTESLQLRGQGNRELKLNRRAYLAGKPSLKLVGDEDHERDDLLLMGRNAGPGPSKVLRYCGSCHGGDVVEGINSVLSYRRFKPLYLTPTAQPELIASKREEEAMRNRAWKVNRYEWGLLEGLILNGARD